MMDYVSALTSIEFRWIWAVLLLPLPWLLLIRRKANTPVTLAPRLPIYDTARALGFSTQIESNQSPRWRQVLLTLAWVSLVLACMRPTYIGEQVDIPLSGRDLMLAIDISPSMKEKDMQINNVPKTRLAIVKSVVSDFIAERNGDRIGLILFGTQPYIQAPLSFDTNTVNTLLQEAFLGMAGQATAIGDAIALGVKRLRQRPEQSRVLILLSDGANTAGEIPPEKAAQLAAQENIKVYTIGVGADEMIKRSFFGAQRINPSADLDEQMLTDIASLTGGDYFRARNTEELQTIYEAINRLEPVEQETRSYRPSKALYFYCLIAAVAIYLLLALEARLAPHLRLVKHRFVAGRQDS